MKKIRMLEIINFTRVFNKTPQWYRILFILVLLSISNISGTSQAAQLKLSIDSIRNAISPPGNSFAINLCEDLDRSQLFSYEYYEIAYSLAQHFNRLDKNELSKFFICLILENKSRYPEPDKWQRLSSKSFFLLAQYYEKSKDIKTAIQYYKLSAKEFEDYYGPGNSNLSLINNHIAKLLTDSYQFEIAISYYKKNLSLLGNNEIIAEARLLQKISDCYNNLKEYGIALEFIKNALSFYKNSETPDEELLVMIYNTFGNSYEGKYLWDKALYYYKESKKLRIKIDGIESASVAFINNNIGNVFFDLEVYDSAMVYYSESLEVLKMLLPGRNIALTHSYYNVGYTFSKLGLLDSSLIYCDRSIASNIGVNIDSLNIIDYSKVTPLSIRDLIVSLTDKAEYYLSIFRSDSLNYHPIEKSYIAINQALVYSDNIINQITSYYSDLSWILFEKRLLDLMVKIYHYYELVNPREQGLSLLSSVIKKNRIHNKYFNINESAEAPNHDLFLQYSQLQLSQILADKGIKKPDRTNIMEYINSTVPELPKMSNTHCRNIDFQNYVQENTGCDQNVLDYLISDSLLIIHLITKTRVIKHTAYLPDLEKVAEDLFTGLKKLDNISINSKELYNYLIRPINKNLKENNLIIIPDEYLFRIPFEVLLDEDAKERPEYFINKFFISYGFSINNLLRCDNPSWDDYHFDYTGWSPFGSISEELVLSNDQDTLLIYEYLPEAYNEIESISEYYRKAGGESRIFFGKEASLVNLLETKNRSSIIHFATHNVVNTKSPFLSHLLLYFDDNSRDKFNHILFLPTVTYLGLKANMVILNGCETGNGKLLASEGLLSMAHAISANDVSSVVFSVWKISDEIASKFMISFIRHFDSCKELENALREVKLEFINSPYNHPYFWAGIMGYKNYF